MDTVEKIDIKKSRFRDADWFDEIQDLPVIVGGLGSLGSWLSIYLARAGASVHGYDHDLVDEVNLAGQCFGTSDIDLTKAEAIGSKVLDLSGNYDCVFYNEKYTKDTMSAGVMFACFDNMEARKTMFENWLAYEPVDNEPKLLIEARLSAEAFEVFLVTPDRVDRYKETLFTDEESQDLPCSFKSTSHVAATAGSIMFTGLTNYLANRKAGFEMKEFSFKIDYSAQLLMLNVTQ